MPQPPKTPFERIIFVCVNERPGEEDACARRNSKPIQEELKAYVKDKGLKGRVRVSRALCLGICKVGPNIAIMPDNVWFNHVSPEDVEHIKKTYIDPLAQAGSDRHPSPPSAD